MDPSLNPSTPSIAHERLANAWAMIRAILAGKEAVQEAAETYLPSYPAESEAEYDRRLQAAPWQPEFEDIVRGISAKPFTKEVVLAGEPSEPMKALAEDIDGRGNNLHVFAKDTFEGGVTLGAHGILVDFPTMAPNATRADEKAVNARPYWVSVDADEILAIRVERRGAREVVTHLRLLETTTRTEGFAETTETKVRVLEPGRWEVWRMTDETAGGDVADAEWVIDEFGTLTLTEVPFVFYATAERRGPQYVRPPLLDLANMQIEIYQQGSNEEQIYTLAGSPMLTANGMAAPENGATVETGPGRVLYAPGAEGIQTSWDYIQPAAENLKAISERRGKTTEDMRRLGLQPIMAKTGNVTATASGIEAAKGHSAVQTWANGLKDALEQAWKFTAQWMNTDEEVLVNVHTDFAIGQYGEAELSALQKLREGGDLSQKSYWDEMTRRGVLGPQFDAEAEEKALLEEIPSDDTEEDIQAAMPPDRAAQRDAGGEEGETP